MSPQRELSSRPTRSRQCSLNGRIRARVLPLALALLGGWGLLAPALAKPTNRPVTPASPNGPGVRATPASPARVNRSIGPIKSSQMVAGMNSGRTDAPKGGVRAGGMLSPSNGRFNAAAYGGVFP